ncbi:MAG TPA: phosphodiesterase [Lachnospiraceae bacterium]|nr:phosphodiesterase [Lachnospiraceae bacterium]
MDLLEFEKMRKKVKHHMDNERYWHTLGVMYTAECLAMRYGADMEKAKIAGLLHDCAKYLPTEKKLELCEENGIAISEAEQKNTGLLHAKLGAVLARKKYHITDEEILHAICVHTTGCPDMSLLDKILYIADFIEPNRCEAPNLTEVRAEAFQDLDQCLRHILEDSLAYLNTINAVIDPMTEQTYQYYQERRHQ